MVSFSWINSPRRATRQWLAQQRLAAHGLAIRELAAEDRDPVRVALGAPKLGPSTLDLQRQASQELCIAAAWAGRRPVALGFVDWLGPRPQELQDSWSGVPEIHRLYGLPAYRSLRVGARLIDFFEQRAMQRGKSCIGLGVHRSNMRALALYERLGYGPEATPFTDGYFSVGPGRAAPGAGAGIVSGARARAGRGANSLGIGKKAVPAKGWRVAAVWRNMGPRTFSGDSGMKPEAKPDPSAPEGEFNKLIDEQLELAVARLPVLSAGGVHPSPVDHDERQAAHATMEDLLLGRTESSPEMLEELAALQAAPELSEEELTRQALADGGADCDPSTPE